MANITLSTAFITRMLDIAVRERNEWCEEGDEITVKDITENAEKMSAFSAALTQDVEEAYLTDLSDMADLLPD